MFLISALAIIVVCVEITAGIAQQLAPTPPIRRGADGQIEIVPQNAHPPAPVAAAPKNSGARPDDRQPDATSLDPPAHLAQPAIQPLVSVEKSSMSGSDHPPRGAHVVSQIHNAPGWLHSHTYTYATGPYTRVVNGPGWNEAGGSYNSGQTLSAANL